MPSWPAFLSDKLLTEGFSITEESNRVTSAGDVGDPDERQRSTAGGATYTARFKLSKSHFLLFRDWWYQDIKFGLLAFEWQDPFNLVNYNFKILNEPAFSMFGNGWVVDLEMYRFPGFLPGDIIQTVGAGAAELPMMTMDGVGEMSHDATGIGDALLPMIDMSGVGARAVTVTGTGAVDLPMIDMYGTNIFSIPGTAAADLPMMSMEGEGAQEIEGSGSANLPMIDMEGEGDVSSLAVYLDDVITSLGLTSSLVLVLDAGDSASYPGSGQQWTDVSGAGNHFNRGSTSGSDAYDPTFSGTPDAGTAAEFFSSDGSHDHFSPAGSPTFDDAWHKNNGKFTALGMMYLPAHGGTTRTYFPIANRGSEATSIGTTIRIRQRIGGFGNETIVEALFCNGTVEVAFDDAAYALVENTWVFWAVSHDEAGGANGSFFRIMNAVVPYNGQLTGPSSSNPAFSPKLGAQGGVPSAGVGMNVAGTRIGCMAAWNTDLTQSQVTSIYNELKARYSDLP